jgi:hypothetical protein|tara:strand:+ start:472 stop:885 length:414 start_codon:yes stop_codon:yes gene_type:complete
MKEIQMEIKDIEMYYASYSKHLKMFSRACLSIKDSKNAADKMLFKEYGVTMNEIKIEIGIEGTVELDLPTDDFMAERIIKVVSELQPTSVGIICNRLRNFEKDDIIRIIEKLSDNGPIRKQCTRGQNNKRITKYIAS